MTRSSTAADDDTAAGPPPIATLTSVPGARPRTHDQGMATWLAERRIAVSGVTLDDVVGLRAAKREVQSLIARLRFPERIREAGGELPRAVLLWGPAGTGKTTLARVIASALAEGSERAVPFYEVNGGDLTAARLFALRDHFTARPPSAGIAVVFVDEVDTIAMSRGHWTHTPASRQALYALLAVLDGLRATPNVLWLFTSNTEPDELDRALVRSGRMGWHVETTYPTRTERETLFRHFARGRRFAPDVDWAKAAEMLGPQTSGAEVRQILDDALALSLADRLDESDAPSAKRGHEGSRGASETAPPSGGDEDAVQPDWAHVVEALQRRGQVSDRHRSLDEHEIRIAAGHEAGHALLATLVGLPLGQIALDPTTGGAFTELEEPESPRATILCDGTALDRIAVGLAGQAAERLLFDPREVSLGSADDLERATALALRRIDAGMDAGFPLISRGAFGQAQPASLRDLAASAAAATLATQRARVERLLTEHEPALRALAARIAGAEHGQLGGQELRRALVEIGLPDPGPVLEGGAHL